MIEVQKCLEGQTADGRYPLIELLGSTEHSSVFRTECEEASDHRAAIKLISAPASTAGARLTRWHLAARFSHPALLRIFDMGRCDFDGRPMLYVVMELAEENLAEVLPARCLSPVEVSGMLAPTLDALAYLHSKGFVHGRLQPSNVFAIGDQLKVSTDSIARVGESCDARDIRGPYRAPEVSLSAASDVWSLGITMVQCLTGRVPEREPQARNAIQVPQNVPAPFGDLARHCLNPVPQRRWTIAQLQTALGHHQPAASAPEPARTTIETSPASNSAPASAFARPATVAPARRGFPFSLNRNYRLALAALAAAAAAFALGVVISGANSDSGVTAPAPAESPAIAARLSSSSNRSSAPAMANQQVTSARHENQGRQIAALKQNVEPATKVQKREAPEPREAPLAQRAGTAVIVTSVPPSAPTELAESSSPGSGGIIPGAVSRRAVPRVPATAGNTIWGTVRVSIIVDVDSRGRVVEAKLDSPGPSRYFAGLSMDAARDWKFTPPRVEGNIVPSEWVIDFGYSKSDTSATAAEKHP